MVFSTSLFVFVFLPIFLLIYYVLPFKWRNRWILVASLVFYAWWRIDFALLFFVVMLWSYVIGNQIHNAKTKKIASQFLALGIIGNLGTLAYFKYFNFGIENLSKLWEFFGFQPFTAWQVILPIGISFYIFQAISYLVDIYREDAPLALNFWDLSAFIALFPQLIAGPILRYKDVVKQLDKRQHSLALFSEGATRFMIGFCKKVLIADTVSPIVNMTFAQADPSFSDAWLGALAYALQLYFDFSAYSDMAIGLGLMMGFRFLENFNHPYCSKSVTEFWKRWHISLSNWLRDYLYIPLGGNRKGVWRTYINLSLVMLLGGLWHGANWTFIVWGACHGSALIIERFLAKPKHCRAVPEWLSVSWTFLFIVLAWVLFRADSLGQAAQFYMGLINVQNLALSESLTWQISGLSITAFVLGYFIVFVAPQLQSKSKSGAVQHGSVRVHFSVQIAIIPLFVLASLRLSTQTFSPFLYFQF